ncbi:hypothetical protein NPIL_187781, partial [Nephila pilipes]
NKKIFEENDRVETEHHVNLTNSKLRMHPKTVVHTNKIALWRSVKISWINGGCGSLVGELLEYFNSYHVHTNPINPAPSHNL